VRIGPTIALAMFKPPGVHPDLRPRIKEEALFALFLHESMNTFYANIGSFPTLIYTILLGVIVLYWASAFLGIVSIDVLDFDLGDADLNADSGHTKADVLGGFMTRMGLSGVPAVISLSIVVLIAWLLCYYAVHFLQPMLGNILLRFVVGAVILLATFLLAMVITSLLIKPLRPLFKNASYEPHKHMLGQVATVRSDRVDQNVGEALLDDKGAGIIVKVRTIDSDSFKRGDRVVLFEKIGDGSMYRVISEAEFGARP